MRPSKRQPDELRRVSIERAVSKHAEGSCLIKFGDTQVLCTASLEERVPPWLKGQGRGWVAAVSCGLYKGAAVLDLDYAEDSAAEADSNFVMTGAGGIVEVQGTAETVAFSQESFDQLMVLAKKGIGELVALQKLTVA